MKSGALESPQIVQCITVHCLALYWIASPEIVHCSVSLCIEFALYFIVLHCIALYCIDLHLPEIVLCTAVRVLDVPRLSHCLAISTYVSFCLLRQELLT